MRLTVHPLQALVPLAPLLALLAATPTSAQTAGQEAAATALLEAGDQAIAQQEYRRAVSSFEQANRVYDDRCAECFIGLARTYTAWQRYTQAVDAARAALTLSPPAAVYARASNQLGVALVLLRPGSDGSGEAEAAFRRAIETGGSDWNLARFNLAGLLLTTGRLQEAAAVSRDYLRQEPDGLYAGEARVLACSAPTAALTPPASPDGDFFPPAPIYRRPPSLSAKARRAGLSGAVAVQVEVDAEGCARGATLVKGMDNELDALALEAARGWVFNPATAAGQPLATDYMLTIDFSAQIDPKEVDQHYRDRVLARWPAWR
jgi:protein TonB